MYKIYGFTFNSAKRGEYKMDKCQIVVAKNVNSGKSRLPEQVFNKTLE